MVQVHKVKKTAAPSFLFYLQVLANEQVDARGRSWRSGAVVEKRALAQWFFKITDYAQSLHSNLDTLQWPKNVLEMYALPHAQPCCLGVPPGSCIPPPKPAGRSARAHGKGGVPGADRRPRAWC